MLCCRRCARIAAPVVVDLCSGSGALAVAIAHEVAGRPGRCGRAIAGGIGVASSKRLGTAIEIVAGDVTDPALLADRAGSVDAVLSNPPYVRIDHVVQPEVAADPAEAVFAGPDGLRSSRASSRKRAGCSVRAECWPSNTTRPTMTPCWRC